MPTFQITAPDGKKYRVTGETAEGAYKALQQHMGGPTAAPSGWNATSEAAKIEAAQQPGAFSDATASAVAKGIPFADEITGALSAPVRAVGDWWQGEGFDLGRSYDRSVELERELQRRREERSPVASTIGSVAGGTALGGVAAKSGLTLLQGAKPTIASLAGRGAAEGAAYGALYGAGEGENLADRGENAVTSGLVGGAVGGLLGTVGRIGASKVDRAALPTADDLKAAASAAYQNAENAGVIFSPQATTRLSDDLSQQFADFGYHPVNQPKAGASLSEVQRLSGQNVTLKGLETARRVAGNAFDPQNRSSNELNRRVGEAIDNIVNNPQAGDVLGGDTQAASAALKEARALYSQSRKLETVQELLTRAEQNAGSAGSGGNIENATRQQLKRILQDKSKLRGFTEQETEALKKAVLGDPKQNVLRLLGKMSPEGNGLSLMLHLLGGSATSGATLPLAAVGMVAKRGADSLGKNNAAIVEALIANGGNALPAPMISEARKLVIDALVRQGGRASAGYTGP